MNIKAKLSKTLFTLVIGVSAILMMATPVLAASTDEITNSSENVVRVNDDTLVQKQMPVSVTGEKKDGSGTAVDYTYSGEKEFYTIKTSDDKTFYLIIDNEKDDDNVYFLREINEGELSVKNNVSSKDIEKQPETTTPAPVQPEQPKSKADYSLLIIVVVGVAAIGGYYFKVLKPKHDAAKAAASEADEEFENIDYSDEEDDPENYVEEDGE